MNHAYFRSSRQITGKIARRNRHGIHRCCIVGGCNSEEDAATTTAAVVATATVAEASSSSSSLFSNSKEDNRIITPAINLGTPESLPAVVFQSFNSINRYSNIRNGNGSNIKNSLIYNRHHQNHRFIHNKHHDHHNHPTQEISITNYPSASSTAAVTNGSTVKKLRRKTKDWLRRTKENCYSKNNKETSKTNSNNSNNNNNNKNK